MRVGILVYLFGRKLLLTFFYSTFTNVFIFVTFLRFLTFFLFLGELFSSMNVIRQSSLSQEGKCCQNGWCDVEWGLGSLYTD